MYRLMYKAHGQVKWSCIGTYADVEIAVAEMNRLESGVLGRDGSFKIVRDE